MEVLDDLRPPLGRANSCALDRVNLMLAVLAHTDPTVSIYNSGDGWIVLKAGAGWRSWLPASATLLREKVLAFVSGRQPGRGVVELFELPAKPQTIIFRSYVGGCEFDRVSEETL